MTRVLYVTLPINLYKFFWPSIRGWFSHRSCIITWTCDEPCPNHWRGRCNHSHVETKTKTILCIFISLKDFWLILLQNVMWHVTSNQGQSRLNLIKNSMWSGFGFFLSLKIILWHFSFIIPSCIPSKPLVIKLVRISLETATQIMDVFQKTNRFHNRSRFYETNLVLMNILSVCIILNVHWGIPYACNHHHHGRNNYYATTFNLLQHNLD